MICYIVSVVTLSLVVSASLPILPQGKPIQYHDCKSQFEIVSVEQSPCKHGGPRPCDMVKGKTSTIAITFKPDRDVTSLKAVVQGKLPNVNVWGPFPLEQEDACVNSGLTCPLVAGQTYTYIQEVDVKEIYPTSLAMIMWTLNDPSNDEEDRPDGKSIREVCTLIRGKIVDA